MAEVTTYYSSNTYLSLSQMQVNARFIYNYLGTRGWTKNAICGMLGNMQTESTINPGLWQNRDQGNTNLGYGLVQWTPATKYLEWARSYGYSTTQIEPQLLRIIYEVNHGLQWISTDEYPLSFLEFQKSTESPSYLAQAFLKCYERPKNQTQPKRSEQAEYWWGYLTGEPLPEGECVQLAQHPLDYIYITQGENGSFSHQGTLAIDYVGTTPKYPYYAPCDAECIGRNDSEAILVWKSIGEVMCADGVKREIVWRCIHDWNLLYNVGDIILKNELMGHTGSAGNSTGDHLHLDVCEGTTWDRSRELHQYDVFSVGGVTIANGLGYEWQISNYVDCQGGDPYNPTEESDKLINLLLCGALNGWYG